MNLSFFPFLGGAPIYTFFTFIWVQVQIDLSKSNRIQHWVILFCNSTKSTQFELRSLLVTSTFHASCHHTSRHKFRTLLITIFVVLLFRIYQHRPKTSIRNVIFLNHTHNEGIVEIEQSRLYLLQVQMSPLHLNGCKNHFYDLLSPRLILIFRRIRMKNITVMELTQ